MGWGGGGCLIDSNVSNIRFNFLFCVFIGRYVINNCMGKKDYI